jgi:hypothetical protein
MTIKKDENFKLHGNHNQSKMHKSCEHLIKFKTIN